MIYVVNDGIYTEISIMDMYSLMYCYDECSNEINEQHKNDYGCVCYDIFKEGNLNKNSVAYNDIRESITKHYEKTNQIKTIYDNYKNILKDKFKDSNNFIYNVMHCVNFGKKNKNFSITNNYKIIAHSDKYCIFFLIKPQFNKLNFNEIMCEAIFTDYMIKNCSPDYEKNYNRYNNKENYMCLFTLDSDEPIIHKLDIEKNNEILKNAMYDFLYNKYSTEHEKIFDFYEHCKNEKLVEWKKNNDTKKDSISYICDQLDTYERLPKYITDFFNDNKKNIDKCKTKDEKKKIINIIQNKDSCIDGLNNYLNDSIKHFFECDNNNEDDDDLDY